jgi:hypothetical protein
VVAGWLGVLLIIGDEEEEEVSMIGVDIGVETGLDSAVEDFVVDNGGDDVDPELDEIGLDTELDIELGIVEISGVGDSTEAVVDAGEAGVLLSIVVDSFVLGPPLDPEMVGSVVGVGGIVEAGRVVGGSPQMQMPHSVLIVGIVDPAVEAIEETIEEAIEEAIEEVDTEPSM